MIPMLRRLIANPLEAEETRTELLQVATKILSVCRPLEIIAFGSAGRGEMTDVSDIDICCIFPDAETKRMGQKAILALGCLSAFGVDLLIYTQSEYRQAIERGGVADTIDQEGVILHPRSLK